eukprot:Ihof_evm3s168 gene=Ihof_evmTU3s168
MLRRLAIKEKVKVPKGSSKEELPLVIQRRETRIIKREKRIMRREHPNTIKGPSGKVQ